MGSTCVLVGWLVYLIPTYLAAQAPLTGSELPDLHYVWWVVALYGILFLLGLAIDIWLLVQCPGGKELHVKANRLMWRPWSWTDVAHVVFALLLLHVLVLGIVQTIQTVGHLRSSDERMVWVVAHSIALHWATLVIVAWRAYGRGISWRVGFGHPRATWREGVGKGVVCYMAAIPMLVIYAATYQWWLQWSGREPGMQDMVELFAGMDRGWLYYYFIFLAVVMAPISEELLFRGILLPALARRMGLGAAVVISAVLFAMLHFHIPSLVPLIVFSVALSLAYLYTENLAVPVVMHMLFNGVSLIVMSLLSV